VPADIPPSWPQAQAHQTEARDLGPDGENHVRSLTPVLSKGLEFDLVVLVDPAAFGLESRERSTAPSP
jgi:hypothetical protein